MPAPAEMVEDTGRVNRQGWTTSVTEGANRSALWDDRVSLRTEGELREGIPQKGPYLSCVTQNSIIVSWRTATLDSSAVQYGLTAEYGSEKKDTILKTAHSLTLTGLLPQATYHYRVLFEGGQTPDYTFKTATGFDTTDSHLAVASGIAARDPLFSLHTGDLVANGSSESQWAVYFATICSSVAYAQKTPLYYAIGNHEGESPLYYDYLYLPHNNPVSTESYYSFDQGNSHFISLDTEIPYHTSSAQYRWLEADLRRAYDKTYVFVFMHQHPYCAGGHNSNMALRNTLCPLFEEYKVDMVFNGHSHFYQRNGPINGVTYLITAGGGAPLYTPAESSWTVYSEKNHHFVHFTVWSDSLKFKMLRTDGTVGDSLVYHAQEKPPVICGDANGDGVIELGDAVRLLTPMTWFISSAIYLRVVLRRAAKVSLGLFVTDLAELLTSEVRPVVRNVEPFT
jgi:hypothetical protein